MTLRLDALRRALTDLPPSSEKAWFWPKPRINKEGTIEFIRPRYFKPLEQAFEAFRAGEFGFAVGDKKSLACLEAWKKRMGKDPFDPTNYDYWDGEACLLIFSIGRNEWQTAPGRRPMHRACSTQPFAD